MRMSGGSVGPCATSPRQTAAQRRTFVCHRPRVWEGGKTRQCCIVLAGQGVHERNRDERTLNRVSAHNLIHDANTDTANLFSSEVVFCGTGQQWRQTQITAIQLLHPRPNQLRQCISWIAQRRGIGTYCEGHSSVESNANDTEAVNESQSSVIQFAQEAFPCCRSFVIDFFSRLGGMKTSEQFPFGPPFPRETSEPGHDQLRMTTAYSVRYGSPDLSIATDLADKRRHLRHR